MKEWKGVERPEHGWMWVSRGFAEVAQKLIVCVEMEKARGSSVCFQWSLCQDSLFDVRMTDVLIY